MTDPAPCSGYSMMFLFLFIFNLGALVDYSAGSGNYTAYAMTTGVDYGPAVRS